MSLKRQILFFIFISTSLLLNAQSASRLIPTQVYTSKDFFAQPKNWAIAEDAFGRIYVGNKEGLLVYDGLWKKYRINNQNDVKSIEIDKDGKIYVGGKGEFGYFYNDKGEKGDLTYHPIYKLLDSVSTKQIGSIWYIFSVEESVYFISHKSIFVYKNGKIKTIQTENKRISSAYKINGKILAIIDKKDIYEVQEDKFVNLEFDKVGASDENKTDIRSIAKFSDTEYIYLDSKDKLWTFKFDNNTIVRQEFKTQLSKVFSELKTNMIFNIGDNNFAILSRGNGLFIIDSKGKFIRKIDKSVGLGEGIIENIFIDSSKNLWIAQDDISKVNIFSNYEFFPKDRLNIKGQILNAVRLNDRIFLSSDYRLYYIEQKDYTNKDLLTKEDINSFQNIKAQVFNDFMTEKSTYYITKIKVDDKELLLFITDNFVFQIDKNYNVDTTYYASGNILEQDPLDNHRIWIGLYPNGLASFYYEDGKWIDEGRIKNIDSDIRALCFDNNYNLWAGTIESLIKISRPTFVNHKIIKPEIFKFNESNGLPSKDAIFPFSDGKNMIFASSEGFLKYSDNNKSFSFTDNYTDWFMTHFTYRAKLDRHNNIWAISQSKDKETGYIKKLIKNSEGDYVVETPFAKNISNKLFGVLFFDNQSLWSAGTPADIIKIDLSKKPNPGKVWAFLDKVLTNKDTLFNGFYRDNDSIMTGKQPESMIKVLDFKQHNLTFFFGGISSKLEAKPEYRWRLKGFEEEWGDWSNKTEVRFTNLHEGDYTFMLQAKDIYGNISETVEYSFSIKPPWHRTIVAYIAYLLFFIAFVWGAINVSTRSLKKIIREATAEIVAQKDDIEEKNKDIMSSIRYAQRIQEAVSPQKKLMDKVFPEHFVLWKPRDIVSGDFYWMMQKNGKAIIAAADCTGHGVPGAFMSIMGISFLNEIANNKDVNTAAEALNQLRHNVITSLNQEGSETDTKDGMDISLCVYDFDTMMMQFAGAYNPLYMIREGELSVIKADRMPIGVHERDDKPFTNMEFSMHKGDIYYILSDGYIDQFGGDKGKKFMTKRFKELLLEIYDKPMETQKEILWNTIVEWRGDIEQIDDIIIIGIKVV
jgi:serine phosphatase RsbU (regulator of sigma subunit)/ligand-binding sensor domain-containing protein